MRLYNYLINKGHFPVRENNREAWFISPFRKEKTSSFKVLKSEDVWYDHGEQIGGGFKDLIERLEKPGFKIKISSSSNKKTKEIKKKDFSIVSTSTIQAPALKSYLQKRKITTNTANIFCCQVNYKHGEKSYYSIGFKSDNSGYELRNEIHQNCIGSKAVSHIENGSRAIAVFEGFFDLLSFSELFPKSIKLDFLVLNSVGLYKNSKSILDNYDYISLYLDNDSAGQRTSKQIQEDYPIAKDCSGLYEGYNDLNDFLIDIKGGTLKK